MRFMKKNFHFEKNRIKIISSVALLLLCISSVDIYANTIMDTGSTTVTLKVEGDTPLPHEHQYTYVTTVAPTCTERGYTKRKCECGYEVTDTFVPARNHSWSEWKINEDENTRNRVCSQCGTSETELLESTKNDNKDKEDKREKVENFEIVGYVIDINGNPIANAKVELHSTVRTTYTDSNGYYEFKNVEDDNHELIIFGSESNVICALNIVVDSEGTSDVSSKYLDENYIVQYNVDTEKISTTISGILKNVPTELTEEELSNMNSKHDSELESTEIKIEINRDNESKGSNFTIMWSFLSSFWWLWLILILILLLIIIIIIVMIRNKKKQKAYESRG